MVKTIRWKSQSLEFNEGDGWKHYKKHRLAVPDWPIANGSKGFRTMQVLLKLGYVFDQNPGDNLPLESEDNGT
jgi:hypothetical protein